MSEVASARPYLLRFCPPEGIGLDLGFGGDPIRPEAVTIDKNPYTRPSILGEVSSLTWFKDDSISWIFSSHCLEDFEDTAGVLREWFRVLKPSGLLVLFLPDQQRYLAHCNRFGSQPNLAHKHEHFSYLFLMSCVKDIPHKLVHMEDPVTYNPYSFSTVLQKPNL